MFTIIVNNIVINAANTKLKGATNFLNLSIFISQVSNIKKSKKYPATNPNTNQIAVKIIDSLVIYKYTS